jgi:hypothetical protein
MLRCWWWQRIRRWRWPELDLVAEAMATASRAVVVVNKIDIVSDDELAEVVAFTARVVADRLGQPVPVFPLSAVADAIRVRAQNWYAATAADLDSDGPGDGVAAHRASPGPPRGRRAAAGGTLRRHRRAGDGASADPSFDASVHPGWEELVSAVVKLRLPARMRRRQVLRELDGWRLTVVPCPFGRARATLQDSLREMTRAAERSIETTRTEHIAALQQEVAAARDERGRSEGALVSAMEDLAQGFSTLDKILTLLGSR